MNDPRTQEVRRVLWLTLGLNALVAAIKLLYGYHAEIVSLQADGFHTVFDATSNIVALTALSLAARPPDPEHPYGHRKFEVAASIVIGLMVVLGMVEVGRGVYRSAVIGYVPEIEPEAYAVVVGTIIVNSLISFYEHREGKRLNSMVLKADAQHTFSDVLGSIAVLGGVIFLDLGIGAGDTIAAAVVMTFIGMTAYRVLRSSLDVVVDTALIDPVQVRKIVESHADVTSCHFVRSRGMAGSIFLEFHMSMDPKVTLQFAGEVLLDVKRQVREVYPELMDITVQLEPHEPVHVEDVPQSLI